MKPSVWILTLCLLGPIDCLAAEFNRNDSPGEYVLGPTLLAHASNNSELQPEETRPDDQEEYTLFSFISFGGELIHFKEKDTLFGAETSVTTNSLAYLSGGLGFRIAERWAFSVNGSSTLFRGSATQEWDLDGRIVLTNEVEISQSITTLLGHYMFAPHHNIKTGIDISSTATTRSQFEGEAVDTIVCGGDPDCILRELQRVEEETSFALTWMVGYGYMNAPNKKGDFRFNFDIMGGIPFFRDTSNTRFPDTTFTNPLGFRFQTSLSCGYMFYPGLDVGPYLSYKIIYFDGDEEQARDIVTGEIVTARIPKSMFQVFHYGLSLSYSF